MGNCIGKQKQEGERKNSKRQTHVEGRRRSFSRRLDPWEKTGMVAFRSSHLKDFPKEVEEIAKKVRVLDATDNKIVQVPTYIELMGSCHRMGLSKNRIQYIPEEIGSMGSLRVLLLDNNKLMDLPEGLFRLEKLERLSLAHNQLTVLPRSVSHLKQLKYLDVSGNKLRSLTRGVSGCHNLEELKIADNSISRLPVDLAKLERIRLIVAENNKISSIPCEILTYCESLQTLALHGNPITLDDLEATKGYDEFEKRRQKKWDKAVAAGVLLGRGRFDDLPSRSAASSST